MKLWQRVTVLGALLLAGFATGWAQTAAASASADEQAIRALEKAWVAAEVGHDRAALERILDEGVVITFASGKTVTRSEFIDMILSRPIAPYEVSTDLVRLFGDTAVVVDRFGEGLKTKCTWVAIRRDGNWRVIAEQFTTVRQPEKQ